MNLCMKMQALPHTLHSYHKNDKKTAAIATLAGRLHEDTTRSTKDTKSTKKSKTQKIYCVENFKREANSVCFVSFVFFVDDMQCWLLNASLHAIALATLGALRHLIQKDLHALGITCESMRLSKRPSIGLTATIGIGILLREHRLDH